MVKTAKCRHMCTRAVSWGTVTSCRTVNTPDLARSKLLIVQGLLINLQLDLAAGSL